MILDELKRNSYKSAMPEFRKSFDTIKKFVVSGQHDAIDPKFVNKQKEKVIKQLNNCEDENMFQEFQELAFYQERYAELEKFLAPNTASKANIQKISSEELIQNFQRSFSITEEFTNTHPITSQPNHSKGKDKALGEAAELKALNEEKPVPPEMQKLHEAGLGGTIFQFFQKKQLELRPVGFKNLIQKKESTSNISNGFKKKRNKPAQDFEIRKLLEENKRLHQQIQKKSREDSELNQFEKNVLRQEKQRCMRRIEELEEEVQELAINNYKFKQMEKEKQKKQVSTFINDSLRDRDELYTPYYIPTRYNDLEKISKKSKSPHSKQSQIKSSKGQILNMIEDIPPINFAEECPSFDRELQKINSLPREKNDNILLQNLLSEEPERKEKNLFQGYHNEPERSTFNERKNPYPLETDTMSRKVGQNKDMSYRFNDSLDRGSRFDSFSIAQTAYNNSSLFLNASKNLAAIDSITSTRNKVAFFKKSLVIVREQDCEIAFKRSEMNSAMQKVRLIFYVHNKSNLEARVNIEYDYELDFYRIQTTEKLTRVLPMTQARQVIEVELAPASRNLNSVIDVHFSIGEKRYDLWVPICFIEWTDKGVTDSSSRSNMLIQPDRQFSNYESARKILPLSQPILVGNDEKQAYLFGRSKFGNHEVKLSWWQKQLTIQTGESLMDFLGFILHHFK